MTVRKFDSKNSDISKTKLIIEIYPAPKEGRMAYWEISLAEEEEGYYNVEEVEALIDATFAACQQLDRVHYMLLNQEDPEDSE